MVYDMIEIPIVKQRTISVIPLWLLDSQFPELLRPQICQTENHRIRQNIKIIRWVVLDQQLQAGQLGRLDKMPQSQQFSGNLDIVICRLCDPPAQQAGRSHSCKSAPQQIQREQMIRPAQEHLPRNYSETNQNDRNSP